jgi:hypothetical protein
MMNASSHQLSILPGTFVKLIKRATSPNPAAPPGSWRNWRPGEQIEGFSLPVDYEVCGFLLGPILIGECIALLRFERYGVKALGLFTTTPVKEVDADGRVITENSIYEIFQP